MSRRRSPNSNIPMEQDSFLDIIANLVGILIILVVIFGTQIGQTLTHQPRPDLTEAEDRLNQLEAQWRQQQQELAYREAEYVDWQKTIDQQAALIEGQQLARHWALQTLAQIQQEVESRKSELTQQQQEILALRQRQAELDKQHERMTNELESIQLASVEIVDQSDPEPEVIEHYPTPIAQTVFGEEVHFQLRDQKLVHVPFDALVQKLRATWETHAENLPMNSATTETLGPIGAFRLQYELVSEAKSIPTPNGPVSTRTVSLSRFWLLPMTPGLGETLEQIGNPQSEYRRIISRYPPHETTVSVWVYPESYEMFLELRKLLTKAGYRVAIWPLTPDQKISGSPHGLRPTAQ